MGAARLEYRLGMNSVSKSIDLVVKTEHDVIHLGKRLSAVILLLALAVGVKSQGEFFMTPDQRGQRMMDAGEPDAAVEVFADPRWRGVAQFRDGQFKESASTFAGLPGAEAAFNHANSLIMLGKYEDAVKQYDLALESRPGWKDAEFNRAIAQARAERLSFEGGDMTGGKLGADGITFDKSSSKDSSQTETVESQKMTDEDMRGMWLRQVQTTPSQFLKLKFAYQNAKVEVDDGK